MDNMQAIVVPSGTVYADSETLVRSQRRWSMSSSTFKSPFLSHNDRNSRLFRMSSGDTTGSYKHRSKSRQIQAAGFDSPAGDPRVQQMLVDMLRIQMGSTRVNEFVDESSQHMRAIAEASDIELNRIANRAMKRVDGMGLRVLREFDAGAHAIERDLELARADLEARERDFEEFEARAIYSRNEGLFFKNLYPMPKSLAYKKTLPRGMSSRAPAARLKVELAVAATTDVRGSQIGSVYKLILCGGLSMVMASFLWSASTALLAGSAMKTSKLAAYGLIVSLLMVQLRYEKAIMASSEQEAEAHGKEDDEDDASVKMNKAVPPPK
eukprot:TRINITY_DN21004_c0_g1_i1.p1 TRINITY_DN21004_c0_g1~~TRINITY_DN21004_c0_g1_i1.p1  ORF type:complete len:324 (+),score=51.40 TRINITY_DN21004_c0_g1_i1:543-1514(+)